MMKIREVKAYPTSFPLPKSGSVRLGIGQAVKRDCVMVKVTTESGLVGWGESHHGRAHTAIAKLIETTLSQLILGMEATDTTGIWAKIYKYQLGSHGMGAGTAMAMSGIDMALWDIRGKAGGLAALASSGWPTPPGSRLCRRHRPRLPAAGRPGPGGAAADRARLPGSQAAHRRHGA